MFFCLFQHHVELIIKYLFEGSNIPFIHNKKVSPSGSKYRPDFLIKSKFGYLIVEVDEYQHKIGKYSDNTEETRMINIYQDIQRFSIDNPEQHSKSEVLFIKYNPNNYQGIQHDTKNRNNYLYILVRHFMGLETINSQLGKLYFTMGPMIIQ